MNKACELCRGACCEAFSLGNLSWMGLSPDLAKWLSFHGTIEDLGPGFEESLVFACACNKLTEGKCSIYADRPQVCAQFEVGGESCRGSVKLRRSPEQQALIFAALEEKA